ncbi:MAG: restriction endonuclease subunit S [Anaerolineae bacterium]
MSGELKPGYKQTEVGVIPEDWTVEGLDAVCSMKSGEGITSAGIDQFSEYPCYGGNGLRGFTTRFTHDGCYSLIGRQGALCGNVLGVKGRFFASEHAIVVTASARTDIHWLTFVMGEMRLNQYSESSAQPGLSVSKLLNLVVPVPPTLAEQRAIAEALSDADALIESLEQLIAKKRGIKQGAMQELLTGKRRLPGFSGEWEVKRFGDVVAPRHDRIDPKRTGVQEFCVELEHIGSATGALLGSSSTGGQSSLKSVFRAGDVLFGKLRAYLRKYWWADCAGVCSTEIWVFAPNENLISTAYLFQMVQTDKFIEVASSSYGTHMPRSDWNVVKNYELLLPPVLEQTAIATILSDMDAEIAALEGKLVKARQVKQGMMQELLTGRVRLV